MLFYRGVPGETVTNPTAWTRRAVAREGSREEGEQCDSRRSTWKSFRSWSPSLGPPGHSSCFLRVCLKTHQEDGVGGTGAAPQPTALWTVRVASSGAGQSGQVLCSREGSWASSTSPVREFFTVTVRRPQFSRFYRHSILIKLQIVH